MGQIFSQSFPPAPKLTEKNLPDQTGMVFIVTGATSGVGKELSGILYGANAKVYVTGRSEEKAAATLRDLKAKYPNSKGELVYLHLNLSDLSTIKESAETFLAKETRLHVLFNNAGVMFSPKDSPTTAQGYEVQLATNAIAPFLFTKLLTPILLSTAKSMSASAPGKVRVVWVSSSFASYFAPKGGVDMKNLDYAKDKTGLVKYSASKAALILYSAEFARRYSKDGIVSVSLDPGNLRSHLHRNSLLFLLTVWAFLHDPIYGAYTELFGGLSPDITLEKSGTFLAPWGRVEGVRKDIEQACKTTDEGGSGIARAFWDWSEERVEAYL